MDRKKANGYIRVVDDDRKVIDEQKRDIENTAHEHGYVLSEIYIDTGSGASLDRDGIKRLLSDARRNDIDTVYVSDTTVLSTDEDNTSELLEALTTLNTRVYSIADKRFLNNLPEDTLGNLSRKIYNTLSEMERNGIKLSEEMVLYSEANEKDPSIRLQNGIIEAYLQINTDNRPRV